MSQLINVEYAIRKKKRSYRAPLSQTVPRVEEEFGPNVSSLFNFAEYWHEGGRINELSYHPILMR